MVDALMEAEVAAMVGVEFGERAPERRRSQRNGYRDRRWDTRVGAIELAIPKLRSGPGYFPSFLEPRRRAEQALVAVVQEAYVNGVSTRKVDRVVEQLGVRMTKDQVSALCRRLEEQVAAFRGRPLEGGHPYLWLDAKQVAQLRVLSRQADALERELLALVKAYRPGLLAEIGCGALTAALLIGRTAGTERFRSDASFARQTGTAPIPCSSGQRDRHRLDRGGDRQLNHALHVIAITRARHDPETKAYLARKEAEGKTKKGALRCLKRHLAHRFHYLLSLPAESPRHDRGAVREPRAQPRPHATTITLTAPTPMRCLT